MCRMHTETSRCGTAADNVTLSRAEAGADLVAQVCRRNKASSSPSPSPVGGRPPLSLGAAFPGLWRKLWWAHSLSQPELKRRETIQEMSYTMFSWQLVGSTLQKDKNAEPCIPLLDLNYFTQGWFYTKNREIQKLKEQAKYYSVYPFKLNHQLLKWWSIWLFLRHETIGFVALFFSLWIALTLVNIPGAWFLRSSCGREWWEVSNAREKRNDRSSSSHKSTHCWTCSCKKSEKHLSVLKSWENLENTIQIQHYAPSFQFYRWSLPFNRTSNILLPMTELRSRT